MIKVQKIHTSEIRAKSCAVAKIHKIGRIFITDTEEYLPVEDLEELTCLYKRLVLCWALLSSQN